jgi:GDP-mannose 6-dehydrogenase
VLAFTETIVIGNGAAEFKSALDRLRPGHVVVDLVRVSEERSQAGRYEGICW